MASFSCRFTLETLLSQSDYLPTDLPFFYTRIEEYILPPLSTSSTSRIRISHWITILNGLFVEQHAAVQGIVQRAVSIGTYENLPLRYSYH